MGLEDREWYREEHRQRRRAEQGRSRPPPDLSAYSKIIKQPSAITRYFKSFGFFLLICFAIYGALAMIHHFQNPIKKQVQKFQQHFQQQPQPQPQPEKEKPKPAVRYL